MLENWLVAFLVVMMVFAVAMIASHNRPPKPPTPVDRLCELLANKPWEWVPAFVSDPKWHGLKHTPSGVCVAWRAIIAYGFNEYSDHEVLISMTGGFVKLPWDDGMRVVAAIREGAVTKAETPMPVAEEISSADAT